jgi:hypothetical protein
MLCPYLPVLGENAKRHPCFYLNGDNVLISIDG